MDDSQPRPNEPALETEATSTSWTIEAEILEPSVRASQGSAQVERVPRQVRWVLAWLPAVSFPVFVVVASLVVSMIVMFIGLLSYASPEQMADQEQLLEVMNGWMRTPSGFFWSAATAQIVMLLCASAVALFSRETCRERLGLRRGAYPVWTWGILALSAPGIALMVDSVFQLVAQAFSFEPSAHLIELERTIASQSESHLGLVILAIAILPGIAEEFVFRGYMQDRLTKLWHPGVAIAVSSVAFAFAHIDPMHVALVMPLGFWLGVIAYRANTVWPCILGHFANNLFSIVLTIPAVGAMVEGSTEWIMLGVFGCLAFGSLGILFWYPRRQKVTPQWAQELVAPKIVQAVAVSPTASQKDEGIVWVEPRS